MASWNFTIPDWRRARQLSWPERWLLVQALVLLPLTAAGVRCLGLRRWQSLLVPDSSHGDEACPGPVAEASARQALVTARLVGIAGRRGLWQGNCLQRSLVLWCLLVRQGIPAQLRIGVRIEEGRLAAHAWVACGGVVLNDREDALERFVPFERPILPPQEVS
jgi:hypothetical protein